jgi:hypothetical protein
MLHTLISLSAASGRKRQEPGGRSAGVDGDRERFDPTAHRTDLKLLRRSADRALYENRGGLSCPVCDRSFARLLRTERGTESLDADRPSRLCLDRGPDGLSVFVHR